MAKIGAKWVINDVDVPPSTALNENELVEEASFSNATLEIEKDLTQRFLKGEITFAEYSSEWYDKSQENDDGGEVEQREPEVASADSRVRRASTSAASDVGTLIKRRRRTHLSAALLGLMGEANIRFVRGELEMAEKMCHEIIRQVPTAAEPYQTLAQIYENDADKCLQYSLLAAHLSPSDADEWIRLADISKQRKEVKQEMICYTQAIRADPRNLSYHLKRIELLTRLEEINYPTQNLRITFPFCYHKIVKSFPPTEAATILEYAKKAASLYHSSNELEKAMEVMRDAYQKCPSAFNMEELNLFLELLISQKYYRECIEVLVANTGVEVEAIVQTIAEGDEVHDRTQYVVCRIPDMLPIDLKSKLLICFVYLRADEIVCEIMNDFLQSDVEKMGDLYMDVEEALSAVGEYKLALRLLELLVHSQHYSLGAVWLRHAECLINLGRENDAVKSLQKVIRLAPQHVDARRKLFTILEKNGRHNEAVNILEQDRSNPINSALMYEYCCILRDQNNMEKFLEVGEALLSRTFMKYRHPEELKMARLLRSRHVVTDNIYKFRVDRDEDPYEPDSLVFGPEDTLSPEVEWTLLEELLSVAFKLKKYVVMLRLCFGAFTSKLITARRQEVEFLCLQACILSKNFKIANPLIRDFVVKFPDSPRAWNLLNMIQQVDEDQKQTKFLHRLSDKFKSTVPQLKLFLGNNYLSSGRYQTALRYFLEYHETMSSDAFGALLIGVTMLIMACQRSMDKHHSLILQGILYLLTYKKLRKYDHESFYNIARAYHMLSLNNLAIHYYEKALAAPTVHCDEHGSIDLRREAAFNLYLLYKNNSPNLARMIMQKYLII